MRYYQKSDIGKLRAINQDSCGVFINNNGYILAIVSDGVGGSKAGEVASGMAVDLFSETFLKKTFKVSDNIYQWIREEVEDINQSIVSAGYANPDYYGMGATLVGTLITNERTYIFNVGDSRCYLVGDGHMSCVTHDHTLLASMIESGLVDKSDPRNDRNRHILVNALGIDQPLRVDIEAFNNLYGELMLCSDGLHGYVAEEEIEKVLLEREEVSVKVRKLVDMANAAGGFDNVTVVLVEGSDNG